MQLGPLLELPVSPHISDRSVVWHGMGTGEDENIRLLVISDCFFIISVIHYVHVQYLVNMYFFV